MHISFSVDTDTLAPEQLRGLSMLLTGIAVPDPYQVGPTPGEPEQATIKRSEVEFKIGDEVRSAGVLESSFVREGDTGTIKRVDSDNTILVKWNDPKDRDADACWWIEVGKISEVNGLKIIEDAP